MKEHEQLNISDGLFYEIEYDASPIEGVGKFVLQPQKIAPPQKDEARERFYQMRDISRRFGPPFANNTRFFDARAQQHNAKVFYHQAVFMQDFEDDYPQQVPFSQYYPCYQMMGYEQLRTYFTWRTQVRQGQIATTSLSFAFLYIYELLHSIGVQNPQDGLDKLIAFRDAFALHDETIHPYMERWLKDYRIYYDLPLECAPPEDSFELLCAISKYDIRKSNFFTDETSRVIADCTAFVLDKLRIDFNDAVFQPAKASVWNPFQGALFYPWAKQRDRRVVLSEKEIYVCRSSAWMFSTALAMGSGRQLLGDIFRQMESELRKRTGYKYKLSTSANLDPKTREAIQAAVLEFHREANKTIVEVDHASLARIRQQAQATQQSLAIEEEEPAPTVAAPPLVAVSAPFNEVELKALTRLLRGGDLKTFADEQGMMLEVLADSINVKAMDFIGDNLLDDDLALYEDYESKVKEMVDAT